MTPHCLTTRFSHLPMALLALLILALQGCGDGVRILPPPVSNADPTGYYTNSGYVDVKASDNITLRRVTDMQGMVHNGQLMMLSDTNNLTYVGTFTVSGNDFSGTVTLYEAGKKTQEDIPLSGLITEGSKMTGTLGGTGAANGTFQLDYAADNGPVDLALVVRINDWRSVVNLNIPSLDLSDATEPAPVFNVVAGGTGSNIFSGCSYRGHMEPIVGAHLYTVSVTMDSCSPGTIDVEAIPDYTGLASVRGTDRFILTLTNGAYDFSGEYYERL